ncbi:PPE family protein [Mycobacterium haemophilum]|uniref:PPE domain-containing protein n=1 Tax=Mycobacterium haemophilum TaxID=29311 RepID=A0A0I9YHF4_9MYCO|nr:PPE family protein [Mycobacterium haemophilum]KLO25636.1 hypothetical protein ABH39_19435 [Mycobacterium haemophilum]KLO38374.1 hypothetical protein ABH38_02815 [Mycobacterium haemophilum]KLO39397.1 hypothetical protein ABH37_18355 [Mycobacterium haemophilum]KLO46218.1 hypothetical protein ABH36_18595 [Mycobacterium haemophilum]
MPHSEGLPPEINSANMRNGPGGSSLVYASSQWTSLGGEMWDLKSSFNQMLHCLTEEWSGEMAMQAINAATPFQEWLEDLSDQIMNIARQTHYIMVTFCNAHNDVVHPALINANRAQMLALLQDNELGQNTAAIAALEDEYADYWDQDGDAMRTYRHDLSVALTRLTPWTPPPSIATNTRLVQPVPLPAGS